MSKHFVFINNYPSPYRNYLFNMMYQKGVDFEVYHETTGAKDRNWKFKGNEIRYPNSFGKPLFSVRGGGTFNPDLLLRMIRSDNVYEYIVPGWGGINQICIFILKKMGFIKSRIHVWCEANYLDKNGCKKKNGIKNLIRCFCMRAADGNVLIPGIMAKKALEHFGIDIDSSRYILFPNVIEDEKFEFGSYKKNIDLPVFIIPIRLIESLKGLLNFFKSIGEHNITRARFLVAGDGVDKQLYLKFIQDNHYENHIEILGFLDSDQMECVYSKANALLLPSFYDPSPLTLVEATKKGLVILASNHCGNHFEAVEPGSNGELFNPLDPDDIKNTFEKLLANMDKWPSYSERSIQIYKEKFNPDVVIRSFMRNMCGE